MDTNLFTKICSRLVHVGVDCLALLGWLIAALIALAILAPSVGHSLAQLLVG